MFTGIIEYQGLVSDIDKSGSNLVFTIQSELAPDLKVDQSVSHNGVCLTVFEVDKLKNQYKIVAIAETLQKSNLSELKIGELVNLERAILANSRLDGHIVQGHVDTTARCLNITELGGSWNFNFEYQSNLGLIVEKGSIAINGVSLTVSKCSEHQFSVAIIPYTFEHTNFRQLKEGDRVNIEFDILGKYVLNAMRPFKKLL